MAVRTAGNDTLVVLAWCAFGAIGRQATVKLAGLGFASAVTCEQGGIIFTNRQWLRNPEEYEVATVENDKECLTSDMAGAFEDLVGRIRSCVKAVQTTCVQCFANFSEVVELRILLTFT